MGRYTQKRLAMRKEISANIERVAGDVLPVDNLPVGVLPDDLPARIRETIDNYCTMYNVDDLRKISAQEWCAVCMYVGQTLFKRSSILHDVEQERRRGGTVYDDDRIAALAAVWAALCFQYGKPPFVFDFCEFAGLGVNFFRYEKQGQGLNSVRGQLRQKLYDLQEQGIAARLVDGKGSPVGQIFFLKNMHGWKDSREVVHTAEKTTDTAAALPMFDDVPALPGENT